MGKLIVTNNKKVQEYYERDFRIDFLEGSYGDILYYVRNKIHQGAVLLTHPLSGSVKPGETPYESILISDRRGFVDEFSLELIEKGIATYEKFLHKQRDLCYTENILEDFREIDFTLLYHALRREIL